MRRRPKRHSKARVFAFLLFLSILCILLPTSITGSLSGLTQVLVPIQHGMRALADSEQQDRNPLTATEQDRLLRQLQARDNQLAALRMHVHQLEHDNRALAGIRRRGFDSGRLIPASVVADDSLAWRESKIIDRGTLRGVTSGTSVVSNYLLNVGESIGVDDGMLVLTGEVLVGQIARASTHTAQLLLVTDPAARPVLVKVGRHTEQGFEFGPADAEFLLSGRGGYEMEIRDVDHAHIASEKIREGDIVVTSGQSEQLPFSVVVGRIKSIQPDDDNRVLSKLIVETQIDFRRLRGVFVVDNRPRG